MDDMFLTWSFILGFLTSFTNSVAINEDSTTCVVAVKTSQYLSKRKASEICHKIYSGRLLNVTLTYQTEDINLNITMVGTFWINGRLSDGTGKCSVMRCTKGRNSRKRHRKKRTQCKCKEKNEFCRKISNFICEKDCPIETTTNRIQTSEPPMKNDATTTKPFLTLPMDNSTTNWKGLSENASFSFEQIQEGISTSFLNEAVTINMTISDTLKSTESMYSDVKNYTETSGQYSNDTFESSTSYVIRNNYTKRSVSANSSMYMKSIISQASVSRQTKGTKVLPIGWIIAAATTAVNIIFILVLFLRRWRKGKRNFPRKRIYSGVSTSSFIFRSSREPTDNQETLRPQSAPIIPLIRLSSTYELAGCVQRSSTPLISEMSSTSRYAACYDDARRRPSDFSTHTQSCASYLSVNDGLSRDTSADDYYKLEKLKVPCRRSRSVYSTSRRSKSSIGSSRLSKSLSDLSTLVPYSFPKKRLCVSDRIAFDVADDEQSVFQHHMNRSISKLFSESDPHLINPDVLFQFQLSWETDSESYFMEVESSSFVDNILNKIGEQSEQRNS